MPAFHHHRLASLQGPQGASSSLLGGIIPTETFLSIGMVGAMNRGGPLHASDGATLLDVWVVPGASRTEIAGIHAGALRVRVAAPAAGGAANRALLDYLRRTTGAKVSLLRGPASRRKQIRIESPDLGAIALQLGLERW